jgi:hypothetical protein
MDNQETKKPATILTDAQKIIIKRIIILAVLVAVVLIILKLADKSKNTTVPELVVDKTPVSQDKLPDKFPAGLPVEKDAKIVENFNASEKAGRFQATRSFVTNKSLDENVAIYKNWLITNGWTVTSTMDQPTYKMIAGSKGTDQLQASIDENAITKVKTVTLNFTQVQK